MKKFVFIVLLAQMSSLYANDRVVINIDSSSQGEIYQHNGETLALERVRERVSNSLRLSGEDVEYLVTFDTEARFSSVTMVRGILQAVGINKIRFFSYSDKGGYMSEIEFFGLFPYGNADKELSGCMPNCSENK